MYNQASYQTYFMFTVITYEINANCFHIKISFEPRYNKIVKKIYVSKFNSLTITINNYHDLQTYGLI